MTELKRFLKVFLCHASQDKPIVRELYQQLKVEGWIDTWLDEKKLLPGQDWRLNIEVAVETSDIVIICLSSNSVSKEGFVQKELRYAKEIALEKLEESIFLIPLRIDECEVPRGLRFYQWADYFGQKKDETYKALLESLKLRYEQKLKIEIEEEERARKEKEKTEREAAKQVEREKVKREKEEQERKETQEKARLEAEERVRKEKDERERKEVEEQAKHEGDERKKIESDEVVSKSVDIEFHSLRGDSRRNELKSILSSYDPESLLLCSGCGNKVKVKNLIAHIDKNHGNWLIQDYIDALTKSAKPKKSNNRRNWDTRKDKRQATKHSTTVAVVFRISGAVDKHFISKIEALLIGLDVHYYVIQESMLSALFSVFTRNNVRYTPRCFGVADLIKNRLYSQSYGQNIEIVSFAPNDSELREYGENIVVFQLDKSAFNI